MTETRPLPAEIGATQNALRKLLVETLRSTQIAGHDPWVYLNISEAVDREAVPVRAAQVLNQSDDAVRRIRADLTASGLLDRDGSLTPTGRDALEEARALVGAATSQLTEGIEPAHLAITAAVLTRMRERAEARLSAS
jgi:hypothetical protein